MKIKKLENEKLKVLGFVRDPVEFYNSIDVFASPSHLEGHPYTILEAMSCCKPVILSNFGGEGETLEKCGIVCGTKIKEISKAIKEIRERDLEKLGNNARKLVKKKYDIKIQIDKHRKLYNSVLE
jgi:glycosyltransferase involved in cell wall biosynthesis